MRVSVERVNVPAMSTVGYGYGTGQAACGPVSITFAGDHREMRYLGEAIEEAGQPIEAEIETWQVIEVNPKETS